MAAPLAFALAALCFTGAALRAQVIAYTAAALACVQFDERIESDIHGEAGGRPRNDAAGRVARWIVRARPAGGDSLEIEAWYDSLELWRTTDDVRRSPDTDGIVGGRYRGLLSAAGAYRSVARPFMPDEVAEYADLRDAFQELLPPLPPRPLRPGEIWRDSAGFELQRLGDSTATGTVLQRYRLDRAGERRDSTFAASDSVVLPIRQKTSETGEFVWHPELGLLRRMRRITVETDVAAGKTLRYPIRSRLVQRVTLVRSPETPGACR